jgi:hypothetical protein
MTKKYIALNQDIIRLIRILEAETENSTDKQLTIYSYQDKMLPPNPIIYHHSETVKQLGSEKILEILKISNNIDKYAPNFAGPPFYLVKVFAQKVKEKIKALNTISQMPPKPLPKGVDWIVTKKQFVLMFSDGKKLEFNNIKEPSAKYFKILVENHGLPVEHKIAREFLGIKRNEKIRNLVKTLKQKIQHHSLTSRIKISTEYKSAYILTLAS